MTLLLDLFIQVPPEYYKEEVMSLEKLVQTHERCADKNNIDKIRQWLKTNPSDIEGLFYIFKRNAVTMAAWKGKTQSQAINDVKYKAALAQKAEVARQAESMDNQIDVTTIQEAATVRAEEEAKIKDFQLSLVIVEAAKEYFPKLIYDKDIPRAKALFEAVPSLWCMTVGEMSKTPAELLAKCHTNAEQVALAGSIPETSVDE